MEEITKKDFIKLPTIPNDRYFNQDSAKLIERSSEDRIFEYHTQIKSQMSTLSQDLDNVLQKHEQDYLNAFKFKMHEMMQELTELKKSAYKTQLNSKHTEVIKSMQVELDKSIKNSIKYANLTEDYRKKIESVKDKIEELDSDRKFFESKLNSEKRKSQFKRVPKQTEPLLITALETYPLPEKFNRFVATSKSGKLIEEVLMKYDRTDTKLLSEVKDLIESRNKNFEKMTNDYKSLISKQKSNSQAFSLEQSSIFSKKSEIEDLFLDCVKEVKKEISLNKAKIQKSKKFPMKTKIATKEPADIFSVSDKKTIMELLISNEQVLIMLYEKLFPFRASQFGSPQKLLNVDFEKAPIEVEYLNEGYIENDINFN